MTHPTSTPENSPKAEPQAIRRRVVRAARAPNPQACGCGRPVAFDLEKHAFFCIGCGATRLCVCLRSAVSGIVRPVNVA